MQISKALFTFRLEFTSYTKANKEEPSMLYFIDIVLAVWLITSYENICFYASHKPIEDVYLYILLFE